jgi:hypothetical protein
MSPAGTTVVRAISAGVSEIPRRRSGLFKLGADASPGLARACTSTLANPSSRDARTKGRLKHRSEQLGLELRIYMKKSIIVTRKIYIADRADMGEVHVRPRFIASIKTSQPFRRHQVQQKAPKTVQPVASRGAAETSRGRRHRGFRIVSCRWVYPDKSHQPHAVME